MLVFLDIDRVLNSINDNVLRLMDNELPFINDDLVGNFNMLNSCYQLEIILIGKWVSSYDLNVLKVYLKENNFLYHENIIDIGNQELNDIDFINRFTKTNKIEKFLVITSKDSILDYIKENHVIITNKEEGFTNDKFKESLRKIKELK